MFYSWLIKYLIPICLSLFPAITAKSTTTSGSPVASPDGFQVNISKQNNDKGPRIVLTAPHRRFELEEIPVLVAQLRKARDQVIETERRRDRNWKKDHAVTVDLVLPAPKVERQNSSSKITPKKSHASTDRNFMRFFFLPVYLAHLFKDKSSPVLPPKTIDDAVWADVTDGLEFRLGKVEILQSSYAKALTFPSLPVLESFAWERGIVGEIEDLLEHGGPFHLRNDQFKNRMVLATELLRVANVARDGIEIIAADKGSSYFLPKFDKDDFLDKNTNLLKKSQRYFKLGRHVRKKALHWTHDILADEVDDRLNAQKKPYSYYTGRAHWYLNRAMWAVILTTAIIFGFFKFGVFEWLARESASREMLDVFRKSDDLSLLKNEVNMSTDDNFGYDDQEMVSLQNPNTDSTAVSSAFVRSDNVYTQNLPFDNNYETNDYEDRNNYTGGYENDDQGTDYDENENDDGQGQYYKNEEYRNEENSGENLASDEESNASPVRSGIFMQTGPHQDYSVAYE